MATDRELIFAALHDAIGWQRWLADAYAHIPGSPERREALDQVRRYKGVLQRRYGSAATKMDDALRGARLVPLSEIEETPATPPADGEKSMKQVTLADFLSQNQIETAAKIVNETETGKPRIDRIKTEVIEPAIGEINQKLGQENDPTYLAYAVEYVFVKAQKGASGAIPVDLGPSR